VAVALSHRVSHQKIHTHRLAKVLLRMADMGYLIKGISEWRRKRIRQIYLKQWKKIRARQYKLVKLRIDKSQVWQSIIPFMNSLVEFVGLSKFLLQKKDFHRTPHPIDSLIKVP